MAAYSFGKTDSKPENAGYSNYRLQILSDYFQALVESKRVQMASFLLARHGKILAHQAIGNLTSNENSVLVKTDSIKVIASISKVFTATAIMKLVEDGKLWLEQPVKQIIPEFNTSMHSSITLWHLLTHTSGLPADPGYFLEPYPMPLFELLDRDDWVKMILSGHLQAQPGENWNYSSLGFALLGEVISRVSGVHYNDYVEQEIFKPLNMNRTFIEIPDQLIDQVCIKADWEMNQITEAKKRNPNRCPRSGGGIYSTLFDLYRFGQCFLNGGTLDGVRILGRKTVEAMTRNQLEGVYSFHWGTKCKTYRHGLGWGFYCDGPTVSPSCYNHEGWGWSALYVDPQEQFIYISLIADDKEWDPDVQVKPRTIAFSGIV